MGKGAQEKSSQALQQMGGTAQSLSGTGSTLQGMGSDIWNQTAPARTLATNSYMGIAQGNMPGIEKFVAPQINAATQQYNAAKQSINETVPGGSRELALRNLGIAQAGAKNQIYSGGVATGLNAVANIGQAGMSGASSLYGQGTNATGAASNTYGNISQQYNQQAAQKGALAGAGIEALGSVAGGGLSGLGGGKGASTKASGSSGMTSAIPSNDDVLGRTYSN